MKAREQKSQFSNFLLNELEMQDLEMQSRVFKNANFLSLLLIGKNLEIYTAPD